MVLWDSGEDNVKLELQGFVIVGEIHQAILVSLKWIVQTLSQVGGLWWGNFFGPPCHIHSVEFAAGPITSFRKNFFFFKFQLLHP
jgi:hypothetical protein